MKVFVVLLALLAGVPALVFAVLYSRKVRSLVLIGMMMAPALGVKSSITLVSMEDYRGPDRGFEICASDLAAVGLAIAFLVRPTRSTRWIPPGTVPLLVLFLWSCFSALGSPVPLMTAFTVFKVLRCALVYWVTVNALIREETLWIPVFSWTTVGLILSAVAVYQKYRLGLYRIPGPFDHSNTIPLYVNLILPAVLVYALADRELPPVYAGTQIAAVAGMLFAVLATFSRLGMALSASAIAASLLWVNLRARSRRSVRVTAWMALFAILGGLRAAPSIIRRFQEAPEASAEARHEFNHAAKLMAQDHPTGLGLNAFSHVMTVSPKYRAHLVVMADEEFAGVCHHIYLLTAAELGWTGLALFVFVLIFFLFKAARVAWKARTMESLLAGALFLGCCCLHVSGFYEWALRITPVSYQFTMVCAAIVALDCRLKDAARQRAKEKRAEEQLTPAGETAPEPPR
jgi:O-antigen ligase